MFISPDAQATAREGYEIVLSGITARRREEQVVDELVSLRCDAVII